MMAKANYGHSLSDRSDLSSNCVYQGQLSLYKRKNPFFNSWCHKVYGRLTDSYLCCYQNGRKISGTITFQLEIDNILCIEGTSDSDKPFLTIKTKQNDDIYLRASSQRMQQWYSALCNVHSEYKNSIGARTISMDSDDDNTLIPDALQCSICHQMYTNPVKNTCGNTYCYQKCIVPWYDKSIRVLTSIKDATYSKSVHDPKTNCPLPQNCLLLIPDFESLIQIYEHMHHKPIAEADRSKYMRCDAYLNHYRKKLVQKPLHKAIHEQMIEIGCHGNGLFNDENLVPVVDEIWRLFDIQNRVSTMIDSSVRDWNQSYGHIVPFKWTHPEFKALPIKRETNMVNEIMREYGVDEAFESLLHDGLEIDAFVSGVIAVLMQYRYTAANGEMIHGIKSKIIALILRKQQEIRTQFTDHEGAHADSESNETDDDDVDMQPNVVKIEVSHQIWWEDNMRCIRKMIEFVHKKETFELLFEDTNGELTRNKLLRFLEFGGFKHITSVQRMIYHGMANKLKYEIFKISSQLQQETHQVQHKYTNYWKYVMQVTALKNAPDPKHNAYRDYLWLNIRLRLNYDEELSKFDYGTGSINAKHKLKKELRNQLAHHLGLTHKHYIHIHDIYSGSIIVIVGLSIGGFIFVAEKVYMATSIYNGRHQDWLTPKKSAVASAAASAAVLGTVGAVEGLTQSDHALGKLIMNSEIGGDIAARLALSAGPIGAMVGGLAGVILAGAVFTALIAYAQYKKNMEMRTRSKEEEEALMHSEDDVCMGVVSPSPSEVNSSLLSEQIQIEEPHPVTSNDAWKGQFVMKTRSYSMRQSMEESEESGMDSGGGRRVLLDCGHEFDIHDVDTTSEYLVTCLVCGKRSFVVKEHGRGAISYRHIFEYCNDDQLTQYKQ